MNKLCNERPPNRPTPPIKEIWVSTWLLPLSTHLLLTQASPHWCVPPHPTPPYPQPFSRPDCCIPNSESSYQPPAQPSAQSGDKRFRGFVSSEWPAPS